MSMTVTDERGKLPPRVPRVRGTDWRQSFRALRNRHFRRLWLSMLPSMLAWRMADIAIGYLLFELTGSATMLGVMGMALALPVVSFALLGGVAADRIARRTLLSLTQGGLAVIGGLLALVVLTDTVQVWHLFAFAVLQGALFAFNVPARQSFLTELVHKDDLVNAIALRSFGMNASRVAGPALAGLLISFPTIGIGGICVLMAAGYAVVVLIVLGLPYSPPAPTNASARQQAVAGLRYVWSTPSLRTLVVIATLILCLAASHQRLLPVFALRVFDSGPAGLGLLAAATGIGAVVGSALIAALSGARAQGPLLLALGALLGAALAGFALAPAFLLATALIVLVGVAYAALQTLYSALLLRQTTPAMSGRVMSIWLITMGLTPLSALPAGALADLIGARPMMVGTGVLVALLVLAFGLFSPTVRRLS